MKKGSQCAPSAKGCLLRCGYATDALHEQRERAMSDSQKTTDVDAPALLGQRKVDHLLLCNTRDVESRQTKTLLDDVRLMHESLPELAYDAIDTSVDILGRRLRVPLVISGMTGGTPEASAINRMLAAVAQRYGMGFGLGSQRAMMRDPARLATYAVRDVAPDVLLLGNLGVVQAATSSLQEVEDLVGAVGADALCVHLNPAQELIQDHGDRDFRGAIDALAQLASELSVPVVAKETGCGLSQRTIAQIVGAGVQWVDVSGAGGTTWVGVEALRASDALATVGEVLWDWGIPTAVSTAWAAQAGLGVIASGGIRNGLDAARAIALGAQVASSALPWLRAAMQEGEAGVDALAQTWVRTLRSVMLLTGSSDVAALRAAPRHVGPELTSWLARGSA